MEPQSRLLSLTEHLRQARGAGAPPANTPDSSRKTGGV